jgi:hypothetical protein
MGCCRSRIVYQIIPVSPPSPVILQMPPPITRHGERQVKKQTENKKSLRIIIPKRVHTPTIFTFDECDIRNYEKMQELAK